MIERFFNPTDIRWLSWQRIDELLPPPPQKIIIVAAGSSQARAQQLSSELLLEYDVEIIPSVSADPTSETVQVVIDSLKITRPDWIIAIGGGSVLDTAKAAALLANNPGDCSAHLRDQLPTDVRGIPVIAVPTTSGSGSEVTPFASITDTQGMQKKSLSHDYLYPNYAVLDPSLTFTVGPRQTAISGMDALSHSIEGYWSLRSTISSDAQALVAAKLILSSLHGAFLKPEDLVARRRMMEGSMMAGVTISNARTTAVHAISYPMTVFYHVPHGLACAMLLPSMIRFNQGSMTGDKEQILLENLGYDSMNQLAEAVESLQQQIGLPSRLRDLGIDNSDIETIVQNGFRPDRMSNNPKQITAKQLTELLETIL